MIKIKQVQFDRQIQLTADRMVETDFLRQDEQPHTSILWDGNCLIVKGPTGTTIVPGTNVLAMQVDGDDKVVADMPPRSPVAPRVARA